MAKKLNIFKSISSQILDGWTGDGLSCHYVRFHQSVAPGLNKEPVAEFKLVAGGDNNRSKAYVVDSIIYTPHGVVVRAYGETFIVPLANVNYVRIIKDEIKPE